MPSYDGRKQEPVTLPAKLPLLLMQGAEGIAVGLSTRILPHNFCELLEAQIAILQKKAFRLVPDFFQGGRMDAADYDDGRGCVRLRAKIETRDAKTLVVRELPFGVTTDGLQASIEDAARRGKVRVRSLQDFTAGQVEIEIALQADEDPARAMEALYAFTECQVQVSSRIVVIRDHRPAELSVSEVLRHNTERLVALLRAELKLARHKLAEDLHRRTLVQIFIGERIYQRIEACRTAEAVQAAVAEGLAPFRPQLVRDVTAADLELLLGIPIRRISLFDLEKNRREMESLREEAAQVEKNLGELVPYAVRYLRGLLKKYGAAFPRRTEAAAFEEIAVRELTASELKIGYDREKGYLGYAVAGGEPLLECSSLDKLLVFWKDGRCMLIAPPEKLFVDRNAIYCAVADRERVLTVVYDDRSLTYAKKFGGGMILNKEYRCLPKEAQVRMLADDDPETIYVQYETSGSLAIRQQEFPAQALPVRQRTSRGVLMTSKRVKFVGPAKPRGWDDAQTGPRGKFQNF